MTKSFSQNQLTRYPIYLKILKELRNEGRAFASSRLIASRLGYNEEQVKKDLAAVTNNSGVPGRGREVQGLIDDIETFLGYRDSTTAVLIGVGRIGQALLDYPGFADMGLDIIAAFDSSSDKIGIEINGKAIIDVSRLEEMMPRLNAHIAIICVPASHAQSVADKAIAGGAVGIWNFAPTHLAAPAGVFVEDVNLASSLAVLSHRIRDILKED